MIGKLLYFDELVLKTVSISCNTFPSVLGGYMTKDMA